MGKKIDLELIKKVVKLKKEGKTFTEMSEMIGYTKFDDIRKDRL